MTDNRLLDPTHHQPRVGELQRRWILEGWEKQPGERWVFNDKVIVSSGTIGLGWAHHLFRPHKIGYGLTQLIAKLRNPPSQCLQSA